MTNKTSTISAEDLSLAAPPALENFSHPGRLDPNGPPSPANWDEVEQSNILLNPDLDSMNDRG